MTIHHWMTQTGCVCVCVFVMALTLSTPTFLKETCSSLKLWMNSCSSLAPNLTFFRGIEFWKSMSMNWQYAAPDNNDNNTATHGSTAWPGAASWPPALQQSKSKPPDDHPDCLCGHSHSTIGDQPWLIYLDHELIATHTHKQNSPVHSISILVRFICRDSLIQTNMSCRLRFSLVTEVE